MTAPAANTRYTAPANIVLTASASDTDGSIVKVDFYSGAALIGSSAVAPYSATWNNVGPGAYSLTAKATDNVGGVTTSTTVAITVASNALPTVAMTAPTSGSEFLRPRRFRSPQRRPTAMERLRAWPSMRTAR